MTALSAYEHIVTTLTVLQGGVASALSGPQTLQRRNAVGTPFLTAGEEMVTVP